MRALIVEDGFQRGSLAACRALGRAGWEVGIGSPEKGFASSSRYATAWHEVPPPEEDESGFVSGVRRAVEVGRYEVVFGAGDGEVLALSGTRDELGAIFPYGPHDDVVRAFDKVGLAQAAQKVGLAVPESARTDEAPVVVKPRRTTVHDPEGGPLRLRAEVTETRAEADARVEYLEGVGADPLVQSYVEGDLVAQIMLTDRESRVVAAVQQRASATTPGGGTARGETEALDPSLAEGVTALLSELNWFGIAQVQFQVPPGGEPALIDLNGRFYGSMALALAAGLNLPAIWAALATGRSLPIIEAPRIGVRYHWLEADLSRALRERSGVAGTLRYAFGARHGIWDGRDPVPGLRHAGRLSARALRRASPAKRS
jgi:predicted ATP-grasp superfamily ATP-dependent carboligase